MRGPGVLLLACVACAATVIASGQRATPLRPADQLFSAVPLGQACAPASAIPTAGLNLTAEEQELLQFICWPEAGAEEAGERLVRGTRRGIPPGVECKAVTWWVRASSGALRGVTGVAGTLSTPHPRHACPPARAARPHCTTHLPAHARMRRCDGDVCTEVCDAGSVAVEAWLHNAIKAQTRLAGQLPFCYTTVLGTHNSGITLAAGCARVAGGCQCRTLATAPPPAAVAAGAGRLPPAPPCAAARNCRALAHAPVSRKHQLQTQAPLLARKYGCRYGNLDPYFQDFFKYIKWAVSDFSDATLRTNDQWLSVTDQLNLGVRALELDTHWVGVSAAGRAGGGGGQVGIHVWQAAGAQVTRRAARSAAAGSALWPTRAPPAPRRARCASRTAAASTWSRSTS